MLGELPGESSNSLEPLAVINMVREIIANHLPEFRELLDDDTLKMQLVLPFYIYL